MNNEQKFSLEKIEQDIFEKTKLKVMCLNLPHQRLGEEPGIIVECDPHSLPNKKEKIYATLFTITQRSFDPNLCIAKDKLPLNANLKLDRQKGKKLFNL